MEMETFVELVALGLRIFIWSDVYEGAPHWEDGERREHLAFYIQIENERGDRWSSLWNVTTEEHCRMDCERLAARRLQVVARAVRGGARPENSDKWMQARPAYASEAWVRYGEEEEIAAERKAEGLWY